MIGIVHFDISHLAIIIRGCLSILVKLNHFPLKILVRPKISVQVARARNVSYWGDLHLDMLGCLFFKDLTVFIQILVQKFGYEFLGVFLIHIELWIIIL